MYNPTSSETKITLAIWPSRMFVLMYDNIVQTTIFLHSATITYYNTVHNVFLFINGKVFLNNEGVQIIDFILQYLNPFQPLRSE